MVLTVTLNPAIDRYGEVNNLFEDDPMRLENLQDESGGKGLNVARALGHLGVQTTALLLVGEDNISKFRRLIQKDQPFEVSEVLTEGSVRTNLTVYIRNTGKILKFNAPGVSVSQKVKEKFLSEFLQSAGKYRFTVLSGSLPGGISSDFYDSIIQGVSGKSKVFLDTSGMVLRNVLENSRPDFIKPNLSELEELFGHSFVEESEITQALIELSERVFIPMVSAGRRGLFFFHPVEKTVYRAFLCGVREVSSVGAGDAFNAGFIATMVLGDDIFSAVRQGVVCGAVTAARKGTGFCEPSEIKAYLNRVQFEHLGS